MAQSPGVFSLENVEVKIREGEWATRADYWRDEPTPNTGYQIGGGGPSNNHSGVSKTQFATDTTANISPTMIQSGGGGSTTTSSTALYAHAGTNLHSPAPSTTKTDKITYSTDTVSSLPGSIPAPSSQGFNNSTRGIMGDNKAGYFAGGTNWPSNSVLSNIWKMPFASESVGQTPSGMPQNMNNRNAFSSATHGYMAAGNWPSGGSDSRIYKMSFATDSGSNFSTPGPGNITPARNGAGSSSPTDGYTVGGDYNYVYKIPFSTDTSSRLPSSNYPLSEVSGQAASGNTTHAYHAGGQGGPSGVRSSIFKFNYSTGSWSTITAMPSTRQFPKGGGAKSAPAGIFGAFSRSSDNVVEPANLAYMYSGLGGPSNQSRSDTFKLNMDLDSWSIVPSMPSYHRYHGAQFGNTTHGFFIGGYGTPSPSTFTRVGKMSYSTETISSSNSWPNPFGGYGMTGVSNQVKGYAGAGYQPGPAYHGRVYKYDIPTDTIDGTPVTTGFGGIKDGSASGNETESYWGGGYNNNYSHVDSGNWTQVQKLTYSSDTFGTQPGTNIYFPNPAANNKSAQGDGNSATGYHAKAGYSQLVNYSTGTFFPGPSSYGYSQLSVMSNAVNVYAAGPSPSDTGKYNFATGTTQSISAMPREKNESFGISIRGRGVDFPKPPTVTPTSSTGFTFNPALPNFAMQAGSPSNTRFVKLDYATDVMTTVPGQFIYVPNQYYNRTHGAAASSATAGYFAGGSGGPGQSSGTQWAWVDKYTYSSDTQSRMPDATNLGTKNKPAAGNHEKAYWVAGGEYPQSTRDVSKLVFSTGSWSAQPSARPGANVRNIKVAGGPTEVWCLGGQYVNGNNQPSATPTYNQTTIGKITYSNDTYSVVPSSTGASVPGGYARACSNSTGLFSGGNGTPVDKFTFATTTNALFSTLAYSVPNASSASNEENGYWIGGLSPSGGSRAQKLSFSSGTVTVTPSPNPSTEINNQQNAMATSAKSDANAGTSGPTIV